MAQTGRPPKTAAEKWLSQAGNRARPEELLELLQGNGQSGGKPERCPAAPGNLGADGKRMWRSLWHELSDLGLIGKIDLAGLEMACATFEVWRQAQQAVKEHGVLIPDGRGALRKNPALQVMRDSDTSFSRWCRAFGLTPEAAARLGVLDE